MNVGGIALTRYDYSNARLRNDIRKLEFELVRVTPQSLMPRDQDARIPVAPPQRALPLEIDINGLIAWSDIYLSIHSLMHANQCLRYANHL